MSVITNRIVNPRYIGADGKAGGGAASWDQGDVASVNVVLAENLAVPPKPVTAVPEINPYVHVPAASGTGGAVTTDVTTSPSTPGRDVFRVRWTSAATAFTTTDLVRRTSNMPVTPGKWYGLTFNVTNAGGLRDYVASLQWLDGGGSGIPQTHGPQTPVGGSDVWVTVVAQAPALAATVRLDLDLATSSSPLWQVGDGYDIRESMIIEGDTEAEVQAAIAPYFDGNMSSPDPLIDFIWTGPENNSISQQVKTVFGPDGGTFTVITATADQTGVVDTGTDDSGRAAVSPGENITALVHMLPVQPMYQYHVYLQWQDAGGNGITNTSGLTYPSPTVGEWVEMTVQGTAPAGAAYVRVTARLSYDAAFPLRAGESYGIGCRIAREGTEVLTTEDYFDGSTVSDNPLVVNAWTGPENNSPSTQSTASISAELLTTGEPRPVQVLAPDIPAGTAYEIVGVGPSGQTWGIPGGTGISDGDQVRLVDRRAPVNVPIHYELMAAQQTVTSNELVVVWQPEEGLNYVFIQSLSGGDVVPIRKWLDNGLPDTYGIRSTTFDVHGRTRPVVVLSGATEGSTPIQVVLSREAGEQLQYILTELGGAICLRTDTKLRDLPPSDLAVMTTASSILYSGDGGVGTARTWDVGLTWIDDPEPDTVPVVWTVDDVDTLLGVTLGLTVDQVDAMFAGLTVDDVDATDWGSLE